jgi:uncharacterized protein YhdP
MSETIIRPTMKFIYMGYAVAVLIVVALVVATMRLQWPPSIFQIDRPQEIADHINQLSARGYSKDQLT